MKWSLVFFCFLFPFSIGAQNYLNRSDSIFKQLKFGKNAMVVAVGSGGLKRHASNGNLSESSQFFRTPFFSISLDKCIYPAASNAYLGLGPFVSVNLSKKWKELGNQKSGGTYMQMLLALKLTHHSSFFVSKHWDVCSSYYLGLHATSLFGAYTESGSIATDQKNSQFSPAIGIGLTVRYYFQEKTGVYAEAAMGYKINLLNIGLCYKIK